MNEAPLGDIVAAAIRDGVARLVRNEALIRKSERPLAKRNPEAVHQARVATRRLRSDLRTFRGALDSDWVASTRSELGWLGGVLGAARDADVLLERLTGRGRELPASSAAGAREVRWALVGRRAEAYAALQEGLNSARYGALTERLAEATRAPPLVGEADRPASAALPAIVRHAWRTLDRRSRSLADEPSDAELHAVRIEAKRCRYAAEACAPLLGKPARKLARAAEALQEVLGELSDAIAAEQWLEEWAQHANSRSGAFAAGELAALERTAARRVRSRWPKAWNRVETVAPS